MDTKVSEIDESLNTRGFLFSQHQCEINTSTINKSVHNYKGQIIIFLIYRGYCTNCGYKMMTNILNKDEHSLLTKHASTIELINQLNQFLTG